MNRVIEMANVDYPHSHTNEGDDLDDRQSLICEKLVEALFYWVFHKINKNNCQFGCLTHLGQLLSKLIQFLLQRSLLLLSGSHLVTNLTDLSRDTCCNSNTSGFSSGDISALKREGENN